MNSEFFARNGSPLAGKRIPRDWKWMDALAKRACLVANGWASDFGDAGRVLGLHAQSAVQGRKAKAHREKLARMAMARFEN